jgi:hypothetical protein
LCSRAPRTTMPLATDVLHSNGDGLGSDKTTAGPG